MLLPVAVAAIVVATPVASPVLKGHGGHLSPSEFIKLYFLYYNGKLDAWSCLQPPPDSLAPPPLLFISKPKSTLSSPDFMLRKMVFWWLLSCCLPFLVPLLAFGCCAKLSILVSNLLNNKMLITYFAEGTFTGLSDHYNCLPIILQMTIKKSKRCKRLGGLANRSGTKISEFTPSHRLSTLKRSIAGYIPFEISREFPKYYLLRIFLLKENIGIYSQSFPSSPN